MQKNLFPFSAVIGRELAKKSLIYNAIDPFLGGTIFMGQRGCAKSTLVRSFKEIFPLQNNVDEEKIPPFIEVPITPAGVPTISVVR